MLALALPALLVCILVSAGGWRIHDGRVERVSHSTASPPVPVVPTTGNVPPNDNEITFVHHLSPSVPWPAWVGLILLCVLPAVASMLAWSAARRSRDATFST
jgi:hypothetical protein